MKDGRKEHIISSYPLRSVSFSLVGVFYKLIEKIVFGYLPLCSVWSQKKWNLKSHPISLLLFKSLLSWGGEFTVVWCFFFRGWIGVSISRTLKKSIFWVMGDFWVFPAPGQADFLQQRHLRHWAENFQKVWYEKNFLKNF